MTITAPWVGTTLGGSGAFGPNTTVTVDVSGATDGEVVFIFGTIGDAQAALLDGTNIPAGWNIAGQAQEGTSGSSSIWAGIFWKVKNSGDTTVTITWPTSSRYQFTPISWPGLDTTTPFETPVWATHTSGASYVTPSDTPADATRWAVGQFTSRGSTAVVTFTPDAALTEREDDIGATSPFIAQGIQDSNAPVTFAAQQYTSVGQTASHGLAGIMFLIPASSGTSVTPPNYMMLESGTGTILLESGTLLATE